jgi:hypothetical protein
VPCHIKIQKWVFKILQNLHTLNFHLQLLCKLLIEFQIMVCLNLMKLQDPICDYLWNNYVFNYPMIVYELLYFSLWIIYMVAMQLSTWSSCFPNLISFNFVLFTIVIDYSSMSSFAFDLHNFALSLAWSFLFTLLLSYYFDYIILIVGNKSSMNLWWSFLA